jgi:hypothetical protein
VAENGEKWCRIRFSEVALLTFPQIVAIKCLKIAKYGLVRQKMRENRVLKVKRATPDLDIFEI